jgi:hypothetical protein
VLIIDFGNNDPSQEGAVTILGQSLPEQDKGYVVF